MYSRIVNPITGRTVSVRGTAGKNILRNYVAALSNILKGGSHSHSGQRSLWRAGADASPPRTNESVTEDDRVRADRESVSGFVSLQEEAQKIFKASGFSDEYSTMFIVGYMVGVDPSRMSSFALSRDLDGWRKVGHPKPSPDEIATFLYNLKGIGSEPGESTGES